MILGYFKSMLKSKSNIAYLILFIFLFIVLNISLNIIPIINSYYDTKIVDAEAGRTIYIPNTEIILTQDQQNQIKNIKHVENITTEILDFETYTIPIYDIIIDDWKNVEYVQNIFSKYGIKTERQLVDNPFFTSYNNVKMASTIIKYTMILIVIFLFIFISINILNSEKENIKLLYFTGYNSNKIKFMIFCIFIIIYLISFLLGFILYNLFQYIILKYFVISIKLNLIKNISINLSYIVILSIFVCNRTKKILKSAI